MRGDHVRARGLGDFRGRHSRSDASAVDAELREFEEPSDPGQIDTRAYLAKKQAFVGLPPMVTTPAKRRQPNECDGDQGLPRFRRPGLVCAHVQLLRTRRLPP